MPVPPYIPFREFARQCVGAAKRLMLGTDDELRYACLELRLAIEALAYDTLQSYSEDVGDAVDLAHREWQPSKVLKALCDYDPIADLALRIEVREVGSDGNPKRGPPMFTGVDDRFDAEWAEKAHRSMGSFLHHRTISQIRRGKQIDRILLLREAERIVGRLEAILASPIHGTRSGLRFGYSCPDCGGHISVAKLPLLLMGQAKTSCSSCGAEWEAASGGEDAAPKFTRRA